MGGKDNGEEGKGRKGYDNILRHDLDLSVIWRHWSHDHSIRHMTFPIVPSLYGLMEFAGMDKAAQSKMGVWIVDNAGVDISAPHCRGELLQEWTIRQSLWFTREKNILK